MYHHIPARCQLLRFAASFGSSSQNSTPGTFVGIGLNSLTPTNMHSSRPRDEADVCDFLDRFLNQLQAAHDVQRQLRATLEALGDLAGRIVVDATNPVGPPFTGLDVAGSDSGGEIVQRKLPGARVVKAFNQTGWQNMAEARSFEHGRPVMFVAGDDAEARAVVLGLAGDLGFEGVDAGALAMSRYLEPLAMLWIRLANAQGQGQQFAFSLVRR